MAVAAAMGATRHQGCRSWRQHMPVLLDSPVTCYFDVSKLHCMISCWVFFDYCLWCAGCAGEVTRVKLLMNTRTRFTCLFLLRSYAPPVWYACLS